MSEQKGEPMKDLDFDELHQAVSKLMDQATKPKAAKKTKAKEPAKSEPVATLPEPAPKPVAAVAAKVEDDDTHIAVKRIPRAVVVTPRRKGIAMDVVQPKPAATEPPSVKTSRTAPTLQPTKQVTPEPPQPIVAPAPEPTKEPEVSEDTLASLDMLTDAPKPAAQPEADVHKSAFPDPLDVHGFTADEPKKDEPAKEVTAPTMQHTAPPVTPVAESALTKPDPAPDTPFVKANVEKRPLGAFATTQAEPLGTEEPGFADKPEPQPSKDHQDDTPAQPKELSPEVVAVESAEPEFTDDTQETRANMDDLRQMSIPQQYKTAQKEPATEGTHPIFDTKTYHPPLNPGHTAHRPSRVGGLLTIILIILVIVAGVGAYFLTIGGLDITKIF